MKTQPFKNTSKKPGFREWVDDKGECWLAQWVQGSAYWNIYRRRNGNTTYLRTITVNERQTPRNIQAAFEGKK